MATTIYRLAEECQLLLSGGTTAGAFNPTINELKIAVAQVANALFKVDYFPNNLSMGESIPNGAALGLYESVAVTQSGLVSKSVLPAKPIKLPRNMGVWSIWPAGHPELGEFIPLQMGQTNLLRSQPSILSDLSGQIGYENQGGMSIVYNKDLTLMEIDGEPISAVDMQLVILDFTQYGDWDNLPIPAEQEWDIKKQVVAMYANMPIADKTVDPGVNEQVNTPINKQRQA